jgi:hypothetical protein
MNGTNIYIFFYSFFHPFCDTIPKFGRKIIIIPFIRIHYNEEYRVSNNASAVCTSDRPTYRMPTDENLQIFLSDILVADY